MWFRRRAEAQNELLSKVNDISQKLQQVIDENKKLQAENKKLHEDVAQKDQLLKKEKDRYKVIDGMLLSEEQAAVVDLLEYTNNCYFITGKAGTGKSTILKYFVSNT